MACCSSWKYVLIPCDPENDLEERCLLDNGDDDGEETEVANFFGQTTSVRLTTLLRPSQDREPGLYVYSSSSRPSHDQPNIRATRLAMACGLLSLRFKGDVLVFRHFSTPLSVSELHGAACVSPDLRRSVQTALLDDSTITSLVVEPPPSWLRTASQQNYHDAAVLQELAQVMASSSSSNQEQKNVDEASDDSSSEEDSSKESGDDVSPKSNRQFLAKEPLCLQCRGPSRTLCPDCEGVYFCPPPRTCRQACWSHDCVCATWNVYSSRRLELKQFPAFDSINNNWHLPLLTRENELSEEPCKRFLKEELGLTMNESTSWWRTETDGWAGGQSQSAKTVDPSIRRTFEDGFAPVTDTPPQRRPTEQETQEFETNELGLLRLVTWKDYYKLRGIPLSSPVALLLTFPVTIYHALATFGEVPITVARMLTRPLRIHLVGVEKELNFLDIFQELGYLLPEDLKVELVFIVRKDMLPPKATEHQEQIQLTDNLSIHVVSGTYGDDGGLDPNFDCGSGAPDMIIGLNAGLFAYESWRSVIEYLHHHEGVVGVFTDYNEHSGMNCAALGGSSVLHINPFRQPRAMPVFSMNLPQFSNGFIYVYNQQEID